MSNIAGKVLLEAAPSGGELNEIFQTKALRFAFLEQLGPDKFRPFHPTVKCRDFLNDIIQAKFMNEGFEIYGLEMSAEENKLSDEALQLAIQFPTADQKNHFIAHFGFLLKKESEFFDVAPSRLFDVSNREASVVILGDKYWQSATFLISLYTFMCRCVMYVDSPDYDWKLLVSQKGVDAGYMKSMLDQNFDKVLPKIKLVSLKDAPSPAGFNTSSPEDAHDEGGIQSLLRSIQYKNIYGRSNFFAEQLKKLCA